MTITAQLGVAGAEPATISGQVDLAQARGADGRFAMGGGKWLAAHQKAHDTAAATARRDARARMLADVADTRLGILRGDMAIPQDLRDRMRRAVAAIRRGDITGADAHLPAVAVDPRLGTGTRGEIGNIRGYLAPEPDGAQLRGVSVIGEQADAARAARQRRYVGQKPAAGETFYLPDPDKHGQNVMVRAADEDGHVRVEDAAGRRTVLPAAFISRPMAPNRFTGGPPPASSGLLLDPPIKAPASSASGVEPADPADADDPVSRQLDADIASGIKEAQSPKDRAIKAGLDSNYFGNSADTSVVTFGNGHQWIRKRGLDEDEMDREVLVSRVSDVLGAGAPHVLLRDVPGGSLKPHGHMGRITRGPDREMWEPMVPNAEPAAVALTDPDDRDIMDLQAKDDLVNSRQGAKIGILDTITDNGDRHEGNWMVQHGPAGDNPVPIDHGGALMDDPAVTEYGGIGPFSQNLVGNGAESELLAMIPAASWTAWEKGVAALKPQFKAYGMTGELNNVRAALHSVAQMSAEGKAEAPGTLGHPLIVDDPALWAGAAP